MIRIPLTRGKCALVDDCDAFLAEFTWSALPGSAGSAWYAVRNIRGSRTHLRLHRCVLGFTDEPVIVDHLNGDGLDCRRANLRVVDATANSQNRALNANSRSGFKGVYLRATGGWIAQLTVGRRRIRLGSFPSGRAAARAYDDAARQHYGEFACLNFPREGERGCRRSA